VPVVGQTTLQPGEETTVSVEFSMHEGMGGPHTFEIVVPSNDLVSPEIALLVSAEFPLP
jgi:hypothetical protein